MEVREGYKQTEGGVIPSDWVVKVLGDCLKKNPEYGINAPAVTFSDNLPTYIRITDISEDGKFLKDNKTSVNHLLAENYYLQNGDLVFARTGASVGKTYLYDPSDGKLVFAGFLIRIQVNPKKLNSKYLESFTRTQIYWNWVRVMSMRSGQPGINGNEYKQLPIPLPPTIAEQTIIANVLSDADALISKLEELIAKKRNIKQGGMQELLTGKKRLPGFSGKWEVRKLGDVIDDIADGGTPPTSNTNYFGGKINWVVIEDIQDEIYSTKQTLTESGLARSSSKLWKPETIILSTGATIGEVGITKVNTATKQGICGIVVKESTSNLFLKYWFQQNKAILLSMAQGSSIREVRPPKLVQIETKIPKEKIEQQTIVQVLLDMDAEIEQLEQKRDKYKMIKQGMMQELLTGKIRLI